MEFSNGSSRPPRSEYRYLESKLRELDEQESYQQARETAEQMVALVDANREFFDEPEDRIRVLQARKLAIMIKERRFLGGRSVPDLYRQRAEWSTPSSCLGQACQAADVTECAKRRPSLSRRQQRMCVEKFSSICDALKIEAALAARAFQVDEALDKRRKSVEIHREVVKFDNTTKRRANQRYLEYWQSVTEHYCSLLKGDFLAAKQWLRVARGLGRTLPQKECFPNYFRDLPEMTGHEVYIDALEKVKDRAFGDAANLFQKWLDMFRDRERKRDLRFDNISIFQKACAILDRLPREEVSRDDWAIIDGLVDHSSVARTTWALKERLDWLREYSFKVRREHQEPADVDLVREALTQELNKVAEQWALFIPDTALLGEDRIAGLRRQVNLLAFVDLFDHLDESNEDWGELLIQNLKNFLLVMADYEAKRYCTPPPDEENLPREKSIPLPSEAMTIPQLIKLILQYLQHRSERHADYFRQALSWLDSIEEAVKQRNCTKAKEALWKFFDEIRFKPHVIYVKRQSDISRPVFLDEDTPNFLAHETVALRVWSGAPQEIIFEGPQNLKEGCFYYLRPLWNTRLQEHRRIRHEQFLESDVPRWVNVFYDGVFKGDGKSPKDKFQKWILQFGQDERLLACRLYSMVKFYREDAVRDMWLRLYREELPPEAKTRNVAYFGLGHTAKSGPYTCHYHLRQAMTRLTTSERSFEFKEAFREISEFDTKTEKPQTVIFVDDFIGTGKQAIGVFGSYFDRYDWLKAASVYYCALVGFKSGIQNIKVALPGMIKDVFVSEILDDKDKAFSVENPVWQSEEARRKGEQWAAEIGRQVITGRPGYDDPEQHKLGWEGSQALEVFHYNVPNNTLPLFWGDQERNQKRWIPLWERYD